MFQKHKLVSLIRFGEDEVPPIDFNTLADNPAFLDFVKAHVEKEVTPLKNKNADLLNEKKTLAERMRAFESGIQEKDDLEAMKAGKLDFQTLLDKRINASSATWQERLAAEQAEKEELRKTVSEKDLRLQDVQIQHQVATVAMQNEFFQHSAIDDLMHIAAQTWKVSDGGGLVARDSSGNIVLGKNGAPITPADWIDGLKSSKPHYFKNMPGSGARGAPGSGKAISLKEWQSALSTANPEEQRALLAKRQSGEISIQS